MRVVRRPQTFEAMEITATTTSDDFQTLYATATPNGTANIDAAKLSGGWIVTTSDSPEWSGRFAVGDLIAYTEPIFQKLEPPADYAPYDQVYVTTP